MNGLSSIVFENRSYFLVGEENTKVKISARYFFIFYSAVIQKLELSQNLEEVKGFVKQVCIEQIPIDSAFKEKLIDTLFYRVVIQRKELVEELERSSSFSIKDFEDRESLMFLSCALPFKDHSLFQTRIFLNLVGKGALLRKRTFLGKAQAPPPRKRVCIQKEAEVDRRTTLSLEDIEAVFSGAPPKTKWVHPKINEEKLISTFVDYCYKKRYNFIQKDILNRFRELKTALSGHGLTMSSTYKEHKLARVMVEKMREVIEEEIQSSYPYLSSITSLIVRKNDKAPENFLQRLIQYEMSKNANTLCDVTAIHDILQNERIRPFFSKYNSTMLGKRMDETREKLSEKHRV